MFNLPAVLDIGSSTLKLGLAGYDKPKVVCENIIGRPRLQDIVSLTGKTEKYVGSEAQSKRAILNISYPVQKGYIKNVDDLEEIIHYAFYRELKETPEEHPLLLTELPLANDKYRTDMASLVFEKFNFPSLHMKPTSLLSLFASGRTTGIVLDSGEGMNWAVPISETYTFPHAILNTECAGSDVTSYLMSKMRSSTGKGFDSSTDREIVQNIKKKLCFCNTESLEEKEARKKLKRECLKKKKNFQKEVDKRDKKLKDLEIKRKKLDVEEQGPVKKAIKEIEEEKKGLHDDFKKAESELKRMETQKKKKRVELMQQYVLPDGNKVSLSKERFQAVEILFDPTEVGMEVPGVHELVYNSTQLCNMIVRPDLYRNIVLAGGNTLIDGFNDRFKKEIESLLPKSDTKVKINVVAPQFREYSSWVGGSIYSLMPTFHEQALTKEEYEENGDNAWLNHDNVKKWEKYLYN